jgi:hypothetical protein
MKEYDSASFSDGYSENYSACYEVNVNYHEITTGCTVAIIQLPWSILYQIICIIS